MPDEGQIIRGIDWRQTFPFTHIFRSFRVAIHLSKLALGLALLLAVFFGGRFMDGVWFSSARAMPGEIAQFQEAISTGAPWSLTDWRQDARNGLQAQYAGMLQEYNVIKPDKPDDLASIAAAQQNALTAAKDGDDLSKLEDAIRAQRDADVKAANDAYDTLSKAVDADTTKSAKDKQDAKDQAARDRDSSIVAAYDKSTSEITSAKTISGEGLFDAFFQYQIRQVYLVVEGVIHNDWLSPDGAVRHVYYFFAVGPVWLIWNHTIFFVFFGLWFLLVWALFGGAICRIAAVHVARDEKISVRQAMNFAVGKLLSFGSAPVIPIIIVIAIGLLVAAGSLLANFPFIGPIALGAFFILAIIAGFVMTLVLLGTAGGFNLMYPTIAVEGSDSFDAFSRSFTYVYTSPWRMLFYTFVALIYGAATYLFVHCFIWMTLVLAHHFVAMGIFTKAANTLPLLSVMWPNPESGGRLTYAIDKDSLSFAQRIGADLIYLWVMFLVSFLGAFAISLYFSANTIIYYLMRQEVDSTELDDVYLEHSEDDLDSGSSDEVSGVVVTATITAPAMDSDDPTTPDSPPAEPAGNP
jgi:hypothetical protein